jgi:hypothetical protein
LGISQETVFRDIKKTNPSIISETVSTWGGRHRETLTFDEEVAFLETWLDRAKLGEILTAPQIHTDLVNKIGHDIGIMTTYRMLYRHNWRKIKPDTKHSINPCVNNQKF